MVEDNEITVEVDCSLEELIKILNENKFVIRETYDLNDVYLVKREEKNNSDYLDLLNNCVLIRHIIEKESEIKKITYKHKEYNDYKEIVKQSKVSCNIENIDDAINLFEQIGYEPLISINDHMNVYSNGIDDLVVQSVNNKHLYIEIEDKCHYSGKTYESLDEMKTVIINNHIPIKDNNYFVKKAEIELTELFGIK